MAAEVTLEAGVQETPLETAQPQQQPVQEQQPGIIPAMSDVDLVKAIHQGISQNTLASDIRIARLAIVQPQSVEVTTQVPGYQQGMIVDSVTREVLSTFGKPPWFEGKVPADQLTNTHYLLGAFVFKLPTEYIEWIPPADRKEGEQRWRLKTLDAK